MHAAGDQGAELIKTARLKNEYKSDWVIEKIKNSALEYELQNGRKAKVACMGLAFKPDIDDLRESPALKITQSLIASGLDIVAVEPNIEEHAQVTLSNIVDLEADIVVYLVGHKEFIEFKTNAQELDFCGIRKGKL